MSLRNVFGAVISLLVALNVFEMAALSRTDPVVPDTAAPNARLPAPPPLPSEHQTADWAATLLARPLFTPGRHPPLPPTAAPAVTTPPPRLTGIIIAPSGKRALFANSDGGKTLAVDESGVVGLWTVQAITDGSVTLTGPAGKQELQTLSYGNDPEAADRAAFSAETAPPWTNPCGRVHRRASKQPSPPRDERCVLAEVTASK